MLGVGETPDQVHRAMDDLVANGLDILTLGQYLQPTAKHLDVNRYVEKEEFQSYKKFGLEMGFDGKTLIHPKTIEMANSVYSPSEDELKWSRTIIAAHGQAKKEGIGVIVIEGKVVEDLDVQNAMRLVAMADAIAIIEAKNA